jgi:hypothetical protein
MAALTIATLVLLPAAAGAAGCEVVADAADRADCVARQAARDAARAQVDRQVTDATPGANGVTGRSAAWDHAMQQADGVHADELFDLRLLAAVGGLAWFGLAVRHRRRRARARR